MVSIKRRIALGIGAAALMISIPVTGLAQTQGPPEQRAVQANFGNLISALNNISAQISNVQALNNIDVEDVQVINVEDTLNWRDINALNNALNRNEVDVTVLQNFLNDSVNDNVVVIREVLSNNSVLVGDVLAIDILSDGTVVVFYFA